MLTQDKEPVKKEQTRSVILGTTPTAPLRMLGGANNVP